VSGERPETPQARVKQGQECSLMLGPRWKMVFTYIYIYIYVYERRWKLFACVF